MMRSLLGFLRNPAGAAAAELALVMPLLLILMFGSVELSNLFMDQHALEKQVRDGARYGARLTISKSYACPGTVFEDTGYATKIINVTKTGAVSGTGNPRWPTSYWARTCSSGNPTVAVTLPHQGSRSSCSRSLRYGVRISCSGSSALITFTVVTCSSA